jgi:cellulose biosynthesis protein BcsQ
VLGPDEELGAVHVFAIYNIKGGVGKTATAVNLAWLAASRGNRTLLWDLDPQGAASFYYRIKPKEKKGGKRLVRGECELDDLARETDVEGLEVVPADRSSRHFERMFEATGNPTRQIARLLEPMASHYDCVFLDCAPGHSLVAENVFGAADTLLAPTIPTTLSLRALAQLMKYFADRDGRHFRVLPFFSLVDRRRALHASTIEWVHGQPMGFLSSEIPYSTWVEQMGPRRAPLFEFAPNCPAAQAYASLWTEIRQRALIERPVAAGLA